MFLRAHWLCENESGRATHFICSGRKEKLQVSEVLYMGGDPEENLKNDVL